MIIVIAFNINLGLDLDSSVNIDPMDPEFKDSVLAIQSKHKQVLKSHLNNDAQPQKTLYQSQGPPEIDSIYGIPGLAIFNDNGLRQTN